MKLFTHRLDVDVSGLPSQSDARARGQSFTAQFGDEVIEVTGDAHDSMLDARFSTSIESTDETRISIGPSWVHVVLQKGRMFNAEHPEVPVLYDRGRFQLVAIEPARARTLVDADLCFNIHPMQDNEVIFRRRSSPESPPVIPGWEHDLVAAVDPDSFQVTLDTLTAFPNRHSLSENYAQVTTALAQQMGDLGYATSIDPINIFNRNDGEILGQSTNLIARKSGLGSGPRGLVLVTAHLDSVNRQNLLDATLAAPGADDNGSGSAGVIEIGRVFAKHPARDDIYLVLFGGEEQNLYGSTQYVAALPAEERSRLLGVVNMDMIGVLNSEPSTVLLEGAPVSRHVIDGLATRAAVHTDLSVRTSENPFASDHVPFIRANLPAVLTIEGDDGQNGNIHLPDDTMQHIDSRYAAEILKMNIGFIAACVGRLP